MNNSIVFNSTALNAFAKFGQIKNKLVKPIRSNNKNYLLIRKGARCSLSLSEIQDNSEYIVVIKAKKLNGNGKLWLTFASKENDFTDRVGAVLSGNISNKYITLRTKTCKYGQFHKLNISMEDTCSGEVLIEEILIVENIGITRTKGLIEYGFSTAEARDIPPSLSFGLSLNLDDDTFDPIYQGAKSFAKYVPIKTTETVDTISGSVATTTISGMSWLNKVSPIFPELRVIKNTNAIGGETLMIGRMGSLLPAKRIWVDAFFEKEAIDSDLAVLRSAAQIFSPSLLNVDLLKSKLPNVKVDLCTRPVPYITPKSVPYFENKEFALCFHRGHESTYRIIKAWNPQLPKMALVGARGGFPDTVIPVNEYMPYENLLFLISKCKFIIDIPTYRNYNSAFLDLAHHMGVPIISSNWFVIDKDNCIFLPPVEDIGKLKSPTTEAIIDGANRANNMPRKNARTDQYKAKFIASSARLFI
ncbi:MAG TPA: hypothetical protein ENH60_08655 [Pricia sp.]|nr:hypothetical protein [Pricia sp.]